MTTRISDDLLLREARALNRRMSAHRRLASATALVAVCFVLCVTFSPASLDPIFGSPMAATQARGAWSEAAPPFLRVAMIVALIVVASPLIPLLFEVLLYGVAFGVIGLEGLKKWFSQDRTKTDPENGRTNPASDAQEDEEHWPSAG